MQDAGVVVFAGNDNIRDAWWPYGDADMLGRPSMIGYRSGFYTDAELQLALGMATTEAAKALRLADYGVIPGGLADFVVLEAGPVEQAVAAPPANRSVYKQGRLVAENGRFVAA